MRIVASRAILHVDMDAFYASVEERDRPELTGKPVVVGGTPQGRGVVAAANYAARKYGIHSAMPAATARRLCSHAVFLPTRHRYYAEVSHQIRDIFRRYTPLVEPLSLDEAFLDVSGSRQLFGPGLAIGRRIKVDILRELHLTASVGVAPNKFLAKIASDLQKPDGFVVVESEQVQQFLDPLPIERLWGIGKVSSRRLHARGVNTIGELRRQPCTSLEKLFGRHGEHLWRLAHGVDDRQVVPDGQAKSISHESTFPVDIADRDVLRAWLSELTEQVSWRLRRQQLHGRTVQLKIRFADFKTVTRAHTMAEPSNITGELWQVAAHLLENNLPLRHSGVRLIGIGVSGFEQPPTQGHLFDQTMREKQMRLDSVADNVKDRFGSTALRRATDLKRPR
ncbi:MAG: DNA polymerase IV [Acidiferrobacterales bacterium]